MTTPSLVSRTSSFRSLLLGALLVAASASAAENLATVEVGGTVTSTARVTTSGVAGLTLNLGGLGTALTEQIVKVADVAITTNNTTGLTLTIEGTGEMKTSLVGTGIVEFRVQTVADTVPAVTGDFTFAKGVPNSSFFSTASGPVDRDLFIAFATPAVLDPGDYRATITLTVADR